MDRTIPQVGQLPVVETFSLIPQRNAMIGIGALSQAVIGQENANPTVACDGFVLSPTSPASLVIVVGQGSIYQQGVVDANSYGVLTADNTDIITQQGISLSSTPLTFVPPSTVGFSVNYVIQVGLSVQDTNPVVNPYYNAANPPSNFTGPDNSGIRQNTYRQCVALIQAKAGVAASSGTQITPSPDPGFFGLYSVTVANGATALTSGNWSTLSTAPFIPAPLMAIPQAVQSGKWIYAPDAGTANAIVATLSPPPVALVPGLVVRVKKILASANTGASTIVVNGSAPIPITTIAGAALIGNEMPAGGMLEFFYDGANMQLQSAVSPAQVALMHYGDDTGTANAMLVTSVYPPVSTVVQGMHFTIEKSAAANNGALTATIMGTTAAVTWPDLTPFTGGEWAAEADGLVVYDGNYRLLSPTTPFSFIIPGTPTPLFAPRTYWVNGTTGSDLNPGTLANPFATPQRAIVVTQSLNMNGYSVTINIASGTYPPFSCGMLNGSGTVAIIGNTTTPSNVLIHSTAGEAIIVSASGYTFTGIAMQADTDGSAPHIGAGIRVSNGVASMGNVSFGACSTCHIATDPGGTIVFEGAGGGFPAAFVNITGSALYHIRTQGEVEIGLTILNITGALAFTTFWYAFNRGLIDSPYSAINFISGATVTGQRYNAVGNAVINSASSGASYLPGNSAGSPATPGTQNATGGVYI